MDNLTNHDDSQVRALHALEALEQRRSGAVTEDSAIRAMTALQAMEHARLAREAEVAEGGLQRLARHAEQAVARYEAAEQQLERLAAEGITDADARYAAAEHDMQLLAQEAEAAVDRYAAAQAEAERAEADARAGVQPLPVGVWPMPAAPGEPLPVADLSLAELPTSIAPSRRSRWLAIVGMVAAVGVVAFAIVSFQQTSRSDDAGAADRPSSTTPSNAATVPANAEPALSPAEKARKEWEASQAARDAERRAGKDSKSRSRGRRAPERINRDSKVKVNCDPNDPLCGVDM